jgi:hypothetical protein
MMIARTAWRAGLPDIVVHTTEKTRNAHPSYAGAKSGDREAATRLACDLLSNAALESIRGQLGDRRPLLVPVRAVETTGINLIPDAMSHEMALHLGLDVTLAVVQTNTVGHTRAAGFHRLAFQPTFDGKVVAGRDHVLVDDHVGLGSTLANLRGHIESHGGAVVLATTLSASRRSEALALRPETLHSLSLRSMANSSTNTGGTTSASASTSSPRPRPAISSAPRPLTPSELEWLRREGAEFQADYAAIRARIGHAVGAWAGRSRG